MNYTTVEKLNAIEIVRREDGKYGLKTDSDLEDISFRYRTLEGARKIAYDISTENDRIDAMK